MLKGSEKATLLTYVLGWSNRRVLTAGTPTRGEFADEGLTALGWVFLASGIIVGVVAAPEGTRPSLVVGGIGAAMIATGVLLYSPGTGEVVHEEIQHSAHTVSDYQR